MTKTIDYFFGIGSPWAFIGLEPFFARFNRSTARPAMLDAADTHKIAL